jgi:hypothetical protein
MMARPGIARSQDFIPGMETDFDLAGTSRTVVVRETLRARVRLVG